MVINFLQFMKSIVPIIACFLLLFSSLFTRAQDNGVAPKYSNEFLAIGIGADALGMANAVVAQNRTVTAGYWNPAGLAGVDKWLEVGAMHSEYFAGIAKFDYIGLAHAIDQRSTVAFTAIRFGVDDIPNTLQLIDNNGNINYDNITTFSAADYGFLLSYARKIERFPGLDVGGSFKVIHRKVGDFARSWGFGLDAGAQYASKKGWKFGAMFRDVTSTFNAWIFTISPEDQEVLINTGNELPQDGLELTLPRIILASYKRFDFGSSGMHAAAELDIDVTTDGKRNTLVKSNVFSMDPHLGIAIGFKNYVSVRGGISNMQYLKNFDDSERFTLQPNIGVGLNFKNFYLDYAFTDIGDASIALYSHVISVRLKLDKPNNVKKE